MSPTAMHLADWALEQLAEGTLSPQEQRTALGHVERCTRCAAEVEAYRALYASLSEMPRFAPSAGFSDAVMARVRVAPQEGVAVARVRRWLPATRRGWMMLGAGLAVLAAPAAAMLFWLITHPLVSVGSIGEWMMLEVTAVAQAGWSTVAGWSQSVGLTGALRTAAATARRLSTDAWMAALAGLAVAIALSLWTLLRLTRTPTGDATYAN